MDIKRRIRQLSCMSPHDPSILAFTIAVETAEKMRSWQLVPKGNLWHSQGSHAVRFSLLLRIKNQEEKFGDEPVSRILFPETATMLQLTNSQGLALKFPHLTVAKEVDAKTDAMIASGC